MARIGYRGFRVWLKKEKRWLKSHEFKIGSDGKVETYGLFVTQTELVRCDSAGMWDRKQKEIFEGDIVRDGWDMNSVGAVEFRDGAFHLGIGYLESQSVQAEDCEIIGNIYENPTLSRK